jgi:hypothetical protein
MSLRLLLAGYEIYVSYTIRSFPVIVPSQSPYYFHVVRAERTANTDPSYTPSTSNIASVLAQKSRLY